MTRKAVELDPAVAALLDTAGRQAHSQRTRRTPAGRLRAARATPRTSITLELNADLAQILRDTADALGLSYASLADILLAHALQHLNDIDLGSQIRESRSPRYLYVSAISLNGLAAQVAAHLEEPQE
jgi:ribosome-binding protein aMBF1 (putative translation factor)